MVSFVDYMVAKPPSKSNIGTKYMLYQPDGNLHILPNLDYVQHSEDPRCVCGPVLHEAKNDQGTKTYLHRRVETILPEEKH